MEKKMTGPMHALLSDLSEGYKLPLGIRKNGQYAHSKATLDAVVSRGFAVQVGDSDRYEITLSGRHAFSAWIPEGYEVRPITEGVFGAIHQVTGPNGFRQQWRSRSECVDAARDHARDGTIASVYDLD